MTLLSYTQIVNDYSSMIETDPKFILSSSINALTDDQKVELREHLMSINENRLMQNLFYNYEGQYWIKPERIK